MEVLSYEMSGIRVIRLRGRLEAEADIAGLVRQVYGELPGEPGDVLLGLKDLLGCSALGIAALYDLVRKLTRNGARVGLVVPDSAAADWENLLGIGQAGLYPSENEALMALCAYRARANSTPGRVDPDPTPG